LGSPLLQGYITFIEDIKIRMRLLRLPNDAVARTTFHRLGELFNSF